MSINKLILIIFLISPLISYADTLESKLIAGDVKIGDKPPTPTELKRIKELGGEVVIDGSLRVLEPIYTKNLDLVEISTSVKPISNHVRIYAIAVGTYTVIKVQFDDGQEKILTNN